MWPLKASECSCSSAAKLTGLGSFVVDTSAVIFFSRYIRKPRRRHVLQLHRNRQGLRTRALPVSSFSVRDAPPRRNRAGLQGVHPAKNHLRAARAILRVVSRRRSSPVRRRPRPLKTIMPCLCAVVKVSFAKRLQTSPGITTKHPNQRESTSDLSPTRPQHANQALSIQRSKDPLRKP